MATRIEKIYKTNSLVLVNDILNLIKEYAEKNPKMTKREAEFYKSIIKTIDNTKPIKAAKALFMILIF